LSVQGDFLTRDGAPFFPVGTNYFTTEENEWDFSGPRNAWVWDKDFDEMSRHGVSFVRTGVWMPNAKFIEANTGGVDERFLRNLEAFLLCAQRHGIAVNFTFFAFSPRSGYAGREDPDAIPPNPYTDPGALQAQQAYVRSVVERFKDVPWLSWDLINEPSFSNPRHIFRGNYPNGDPSEIGAWRKWLRRKYDSNLAALASAWRATPEQLGSFDTVPLPTSADLAYARYGLQPLRAGCVYKLGTLDGLADPRDRQQAAYRCGAGRGRCDRPRAQPVLRRRGRFLHNQPHVLAG
jgi:beta-galactosidase GanA